MFYLQAENWSPRFDETFFTVKMERRERVEKAPAVERGPLAPETSSTSPAVTIGGRNTFPACYYEIQVLSGHSKYVVRRRFSQFVWLYNTLVRNPPKRAHLMDTASRRIHATPGLGAVGSKRALIPVTATLGDCIHPCRSNEKIEEQRQWKLFDFIDDVLCRPGYANHPAIVAFLELHCAP